MILRRPPALANWLLDRLGDTQRNTALAGDLLEEFRSGRSAAWYWRQTLIVVANGIAHTLAELWPYLSALGAAYAAQFVVALMLWSRSFPAAVHGSWAKFGVWVLTQVGYGVCAALFNVVVVGESSPKLTQMYCAVDPGPPRSRIIALAAWGSFSLGLANYCLCALVFPRFSFSSLVSVEIAWFVLWIFTPALIRPRAPGTLTTEIAMRSFAIPESEPNLSVCLPSGRTITLERASLAQSVFGAGDLDLIEIVFGRRRSLELLRRAIWLGGCRSHSYTLAELTALIDETARTESVIEACYETNRGEGLLRRVRFWFFGDSV